MAGYGRHLNDSLLPDLQLERDSDNFPPISFGICHSLCIPALQVWGFRIVYRQEHGAGQGDSRIAGNMGLCLPSVDFRI